MVSELKGQFGDEEVGALTKEYQAKEEVVTHLMFHKSIVDHERNGERIDDYIDMIEEMDDGEGYKISNDDFECAIASVFKLVIEEKMDPWNIDLASFTKMYLEEAKNKEMINFIVAGQLVNMAYSILKMQCEAVLENAEEEEEDEIVEDEFLGQWDVFDYDIYEEPEDLDYGDQVREEEEPPLKRSVTRENKKPVSLIQLVDAFEEARNEAKYREKRERIRKEKSEERKRLEENEKKNYDTNAHKEDLHHDISMIWERICWYDKDEIGFNMIHDGRTSDFVTAFMSVLFLHKEKKVKLSQDSFPRGMIKVENLVPVEERPEGMIKFISETDNENMPIEEVITV